MSGPIRKPHFIPNWWIVALILGIVGACLLPANSARIRAHAILVRSLPKASAELPQPPQTVEMWFSEPLEPGFSTARLLDSSGEEIATGKVMVDLSDPTHMILPLGQLEPGVYTVVWQTLSQVDGHEWYGSFPFTLLTSEGAIPSGMIVDVGDGGRGEFPSVGEVISRWLALLGAILLFGTPLFQRIVVLGAIGSGKSTSLGDISQNLVLGITWMAALAIVAGSWLQMSLQAFRLGGLEQLPDLLFGTRTGALTLARQIFALTGLLVVLALPQPRPLEGRKPLLFGLVAAIDLALLLLMAATRGQGLLAVFTLVLTGLGVGTVVWTHRQRTAKAQERTIWQMMIGLAGASLLTFSASSHAGAAPGSGWAVMGDYAHLLAAASWLGGLIVLPGLLWQLHRTSNTSDRNQLPQFLRRFSYLASFSVFVLALTGLFSSLVQLPNLSSLFVTPYGQTLLVKIFLIVLALEIAFFNNRFVHSRAHQLQDTTGSRTFYRLVTAEAIVSLVILLSVAVLVQTPTPRSQVPTPEVVQSSLPFNTIVNADDLYLHVQVTPNQVGDNRFWVHLYHADGTDIGDVQLVRLLFNYQEAQLGQARADMEPLGQGTFAVEGAYLSQTGSWDLSIYIRRREMDDTLAEVSLDVLPLSVEDARGDLWQNPIPGLPPGLPVAVVLLALGATPFIWRRPLQAAHARYYPVLARTGGILAGLGLVIVAGTVLVLFAGTDVGGVPVASSPESIVAGAQLFQEHCASCHGDEGLGNGPLAASLEPPPANMRIHVPLHEDRDLYSYISQGFPGTAMPAFEQQLTQEEIWHLVNYLRDSFGGRGAGG